MPRNWPGVGGERAMSQGISWAKSRRVLSILALGIVVLIVAAGCSTGAASRPRTPTPSPLPTTAPTQPLSPTETQISGAATSLIDPAIAAAVDELLDGSDGVYGVVLMEPDGSLLYSRNANTPFIAASLYKLVLMADIYEQRERGDLKFSDKVTLEEEYFPLWNEAPDPYFPLTYIGSKVTVEEALFATGAYSSNVSARALLTLSSPEELDRMAKKLGLVDTHMFVDPLELPEWPPMASGDTLPNQTDEALRFIDAAALDGPVNITTPSDMCLFFSMLMKGEIVNPHVSQEIFATLEQQKIGDRFPMLLPEGTRLVHKTGNLESVVHDVGIIYGPDGPVLLAAMAEGQSDDDVAYLIIQRLAAIAYGDLDVLPITASPVGGSTEPPLSAPASVTPIPSPSP
jgi:beta-lactamase class A